MATTVTVCAVDMVAALAVIGYLLTRQKQRSGASFLNFYLCVRSETKWTVLSFIIFDGGAIYSSMRNQE